jgi:hypothetical protein
VIEEAAQAALLAGGIGGAQPIPRELLQASHDRAAAFHAAGDVPANGGRAADGSRSVESHGAPRTP